MRSLPFPAVDTVDDDLGVKESPVKDSLIVDRRAWDDSDEPRREISALGPSDRVRIGDTVCTLSSIGRRSNYGKQGLYTLGIPSEAFGTVGRLYVDRSPYLLDLCNGPLLVVDPEEVQPFDE